MGKGKKTKIGYWYSFGIHMGFGRGPIDELVKITVGDEDCWEGSVTANQQFYIDNEDLFGGEKSEGGIQGNAWVLMGEANQVAPAIMSNMMATYGVPCPGFRGVATFYYDGKVCAMNPYPKTWAFRVRRVLKGWDGDVWYPAKAVINLQGDDNSGPIKAMNVVHAIYEGLTNRDWGRGLSASRLKVSTFQAAADLAYSESFGICLRWNRDGSVTDFIQNLIDCFGAVLDIDRETGQLFIKPIRDDYVVADLPHFEYGSGLLSITDFQTSAQDTATNQLTVTYHDPITNEDKVTPPVDNLAAIQTIGMVLANNTDYTMIPTVGLASRLAERDLQSSMGTLRKLTCTLDRRGSDIGVGDVITITSTDYGIAQLAVRVLSTGENSITDGTVTLTVVEDVFSLPASTYVQKQPNAWVNPDKVPRDPVTKVLYEASYRDLLIQASAGTLQSISNTSAFVQGLALKPLGLALGYELWTTTSGTYEDRAAGDWVPSATLGAAMALDTDDVTVSVAGYDDMADFTVGYLVRIDKEELIISAVNVNSATLTLQRGALDSVPAAHVAGSRLWMYQDHQSLDQHEWVNGNTVYGKFLTYTNAGSLDISTASTVGVSVVARQARPYPPGNVLVNGARYTKIAAGFQSLPSVSWSHRDRKSQDDQLFPHTYGSIGPESGVTYTIRLRRTQDGSAYREFSGITGTTWSYPTDTYVSDGSPSSFWVQLLAVRDSLESWQSYNFNIQIVQKGMGYNLGYNLGGA